MGCHKKRTVCRFTNAIKRSLKAKTMLFQVQFFRVQRTTVELNANRLAKVCVSLSIPCEKICTVHFV